MNLLLLDQDGVWRLGDRALRCGSEVEINIGVLVQGRIEHDGQQYYFLAPDELTHIALRNGIEARRRS